MFFFFKQKTAYELRISDWSSDVCSSDLGAIAEERFGRPVEDGDALVPAHGHDGVGRHGQNFAEPCFRDLSSGFGPGAAATHFGFAQLPLDRPEERHVGKECVVTCRARWSQSN